MNPSHFRATFPPLLGGDLNPLLGFCFPLFSMVCPWGISIRVETVEVDGSKSVVFCGRSTYKFSMCFDRSLPFHGDLENPSGTRF
jgi:hypothetical protein